MTFGLFETTDVSLSGIRLFWAVGVGAILGAIYYGGLWWTVQQLTVTKRPGLLFAASFLVRTALAVGGMLAVSGGDWRLIAAALVGFVVVRLVLTRRLGPRLEG